MRKKKYDVIWLKNKINAVEKNTVNTKHIKEILDFTGPGFCLAKFTQVTMHLGTGLTHSCHHPTAHRIPLDEIEKNPAALFNTQILKQARKEMFEGKRPSECDYCWRIEDNNSPSDRFFKSSESWALQKFDEIQAHDPDDDIMPTYLEVDFSNVCNLKCTYCGPEFSTKWVEDLKQKGPIIVLKDTNQVQWTHGWQKNLDSLAFKNKEHNPYLEAFWKWFPSIYKNLRVYRITGGEPLLSKETFKSIQWFIDNPNPDLEFSINTNLCAPQKIWNEFIKQTKTLIDNKAVGKFTLFTSIDGWGERAEYARTGLDFELFKKRFEQLARMDNVRVTVMCTFNIFSITSIKQLFEWLLVLKQQYNNCNFSAALEHEYGLSLNDSGESFVNRLANNPSHNHTIVGIDIPYLRSPSCLDAQYIDHDLIQDYLIPAMNFMSNHTYAHRSWTNHQGFEDYEFEKFKRIVLQIMNKNKQNRVDGVSLDTKINRAKFYDFVNEIDRRHDTNFLEVFPEMVDFYRLCETSKKEIVENKNTST